MSRMPHLIYLIDYDINVLGHNDFEATCIHNEGNCKGVGLQPETLLRLKKFRLFWGENFKPQFITKL